MSSGCVGAGSSQQVSIGCFACGVPDRRRAGAKPRSLTSPLADANGRDYITDMTAPQRAKLWIGPSGWSYEDWYGIVYPLDRPRGFKPLKYLSRYFNATEVNSSFYRVPIARMRASRSRIEVSSVPISYRSDNTCACSSLGAGTGAPPKRPEISPGSPFGPPANAEERKGSNSGVSISSTPEGPDRPCLHST